MMRSGRRVAVLGGGPGGLTTAHELSKRGFAVDVYERHDVLGGRARTWRVPDTGTGGRADLSAEFGPHALLGAYQNLGETLSQIPLRGGTVIDQAIAPGSFPPGLRGRLGWHGAIVDAKVEQQGALDLSRRFAHFVSEIRADTRLREQPRMFTKLLSMLTSGRSRQFDQLEHARMLDYFGASGAFSQQLLRTLQTLNPSRNAEDVSVRGFNAMLQNCLLDAFTRGLGPGFDHVAYFVDGGTDEGWFDPWAELLQRRGVRFHMGHTATGLTYEDGRITGAIMRTSDGAESSVEADWFVVATTSPQAADLMSSEIVAADPALGRLASIDPSWLGAMQIYLKRKQPGFSAGAFIGTGPWLIAAMDASAIWTQYRSRYGDGSVEQYLSIDMGAWEKPGILHGKSANWCTNRERFEEVREQIRRDLGDPALLADSDIHSIVYNPSVSEPDQDLPAHHDEPGVGQDVGNWANRPEINSKIPNLFFGSAFARTYGQIDSADCANEAGKRAANAVLAASDSSEPPAPVLGAEPPRRLKRLWELDDRRHARGLRNIFDVIAPTIDQSVAVDRQLGSDIAPLQRNWRPLSGRIRGRVG